MNNKGSDKNVVTEDVNELKRLLYSDNLTQYGKRKLVSYYDKRIKELEEERKRVLDLIFEYGQIDGEHHKTWVIDQIVRILMKDQYDEWIKNYVYDEETGDIYSWDKGIAP